MKLHLNFTPRLLAATATLCALGFAPIAHAQPQAPTPKAKKNGNQGKTRGRNLPPRVVKAIEEQTGKALTPEIRKQLATALRAREAAIQAANETYYAAMAQATGLTAEQAQAIAKPGAKTAPKTEPTNGEKAPATDAQ